MGKNSMNINNIIFPYTEQSYISDINGNMYVKFRFQFKNSLIPDY